MNAHDLARLEDARSHLMAALIALEAGGQRGLAVDVAQVKLLLERRIVAHLDAPPPPRRLVLADEVVR